MNAVTAVSPSRFDLRRFLPSRLTFVSNRLARHAAQFHGAKFKLSAPEWRTMAVLGEQGATSGNAVIAQTTMDKVRVSRAVAKLLKAGLITREIDPQDRRRAILDLTPAGREMFGQIVPLIQAAEAEMMSALSEAEREALAGALTKIEGYLERTRTESSAADISEE